MATDWEQTFRNWSKPSSDDECEKQANVERMIGDAIRASESLKQRNIGIIPQGSYRNNANVRQESDVDICVCCMDPFFTDYAFADHGQAETGNVDSPYSYATFKNGVQAALEAKFGLSRCDVVPGTPILFARDTVEVLLNDLLPSRQSVASAHARIMADP